VLYFRASSGRHSAFAGLVLSVGWKWWIG